MAQRESDTLVDMREDAASDSKDCVRTELMWERREEDLIDEWIKLCDQRSVCHDKAAHYQRRNYRVFGALAVFTPITFGGVTQFYTDPLVSMCGFVITGLTSAVSTFFNFGHKMSEHFDYAAKYEELRREMKVEVCRPRRFRSPCDVFLARTEMKLNSLTRGAPDI